jgi:hypothetical protein
VYNYHDSRDCGYKKSKILSRLDGYGMDRYGFYIALWNRVILCAPLWIILYDILIDLNWVVLAYNFNLVNL